MKKTFYRIATTLVSICLLCSCGKAIEPSGNHAAKTDLETDTKLAALFDEYSETMDGAYTEKYAADLYDNYQSITPEKFISILSNQEVNRIKNIIELLVSEVILSGNETSIDQFTSVFFNLLDDKSLSKVEKYIVYDIYTNILYYQISIKSGSLYIS